MENIDLGITVSVIQDMIKDNLSTSINNSLFKSKEKIDTSIANYFNNGGGFSKKESQFDSVLDWAVELIFRESLQQVLTELNYKELIVEKCREILSEDNFIRDLAEKKVKASLGL